VVAVEVRPKFDQNRLRPSAEVPPVARSRATTSTAASSDICSRDFTSQTRARSIDAPVIATNGMASSPVMIVTEPRLSNPGGIMADFLI
jgi:hypothetical protein